MNRSADAWDDLERCGPLGCSVPRRLSFEAVFREFALEKKLHWLAYRQFLVYNIYLVALARKELFILF